MRTNIILVSLIFALQGLYAQDRGNGTREIPFDFVEDRFVLIDGIMGENDTVTFYFDTGAATSVIDRAVADRIGIRPNYQSPVTGAGGTEMYDVALRQEVDFAGQKFSNVHMVLLDLTILREALGRSFDGIIGYHIIRDFITEVDFERRSITLYGNKGKPDLTGYTEHQIEFRGGNNIPVIPVKIEAENGDSFEGDILFDSGAALSLVINTPFVEENELRRKFFRSFEYTTQNLNSESSATKVLLKKLEFCGYTFEQIPVDLARDEKGVSSYPGFLGILGLEVIKRFNFILDYRRMKLYLKPNYLFEDRFEHQVSGLTLRQSEKGIYVYYVVEPSPAYHAGIRKGDYIHSVNGLTGKNISVYRDILSKEDSSVQIVIEKPYGLMEFRFELRSLLK